MNILNLNGEDTCGLSLTLSNAINKYTKHESRVFIRSLNVREYPYDLLWNINCDYAKLEELLEWADVLHFNIWPPSVNLGKIDFRDWIAEGKKVLMQFHGTAFRRTPPIREEVMEGGYKTLVMMPIMKGYIDDERCRTEWLPFPVDTEDPMFMPIPDEEKYQSFTIGHSPGEVHRWEIKDTDAIIDVVKKFEGSVVNAPNLKAYDTDYLVKTNQVINSKSKGKYTRLALMSEMPWLDCMKIKQKCHIGFDHLQGYYGVNTSEFMAMGIPSICNPNWETWSSCEERYGKEPPLVVSDRVILEDTICQLRDDDELRHEIGNQARDYAVKIHDLKTSVLPQLERAYKEVLRHG